MTPLFYGLKIRLLTFSCDLDIVWVTVLSVGFFMTNKDYHDNHNEGHLGVNRASLATGYQCKHPPPLHIILLSCCQNWSTAMSMS